MTGAPASRLSPYLLLTLAVLSWAGNYVLGRALRFDAPPVALAFWRWTIALAIFLLMAYPHVLKQWALILRSWKILCLLGVLCTSLQHVPIYIGLRSTTATNGALLNAVTPIFIVLFARSLRPERLSAKQAAGILVSRCGAVAIVARAESAVLASLQVNAGDLWLLVAAVTWAAYTVCLRWRPQQLHPMATLAAIAAAGVVSMLPLYAWEIAAGAHMRVTPATIAAVFY